MHVPARHVPAPLTNWQALPSAPLREAPSRSASLDCVAKESRRFPPILRIGRRVDRRASGPRANAEYAARLRQLKARVALRNPTTPAAARRRPVRDRARRTDAPTILRVVLQVELGARAADEVERCGAGGEGAGRVDA